MNNKYTYSEAQQPLLFKPLLLVMVRLVAAFTLFQRSVVAAGQALGHQMQAQASLGCEPFLAKGTKRQWVHP